MTNQSRDFAAWSFNGDRHDKEQVRGLMPAYTVRYNELVEADKYPYNDSFKGYLGECATPKDEDTAIYMCQQLRTLDAESVLIEAAIAEGFEPVEDKVPTGTTFRGSVIVYGWYVGGTGFKRYDDVKLVSGGSTYLLQQPRQRTQGKYIAGGKVLVKA